MVIYSNNAVTVTWSALGGAETSYGADLAGYPDRTIQFSGTFGGATATAQGSNDGTNWVPLTFGEAAPAAVTAAGMGVLIESPRFVRVVTTGGTGSAVTATIQASR